MVNTRTDANLSAAVQNALQTLLPQIREELRTSYGPSNADGNPPPVTIHTWLERFNKQKPCSFEKATALEHLKREYHSIRQTNTETSTKFMQRFLRLAGFLRAAAGRRVVIEISRPLNRVVTRTTVIITTVMDQTGEVVVTITAAATTTTLATTTGILVIDVTRETGVISPTDLPILVPSSPRVPLRATPIRFALRVDADTQESVIELLNTMLRSTVVHIEGRTHLQGSLPYGSDRIKGVKGSVTGIVRARLYSSECVTMGCTGFICQEEGW
uniref:Zinc finger, CCHC-type, retrotransposon Gag domain protein n=1 Tax=Tanacetum cinerariifolium TaxID=118510 RepID=A0A6L2N797_TANCI|nr:hypothetical protein [Tanacetum cinerariifolium]